MAPQIEFTEQDTKQLISELAAKTNSFKIRVHRRSPSGGSKVIALFEEGTAEQIAFAEKWLPDLAGGGQFSVFAFHASEPMKQVGSPITLAIDNMPPREVDMNIVRSAAWIGPSGMSFPLPAKGQPNGTTHFDVGASGAEATGPQLGAVTPLAGVKTVGAADPMAIALEGKQRAEAELAQERARNQIQAIKDQSDRAVSALQQQVNSLVSELREERARRDARDAAAANAGPKESGADSIAKLIAAITPLVTPLLQGQNDMKLKMMELEAKNAQNQLEAARYNSDQLNKLLTVMMEKPKGIDPVMQLVLDQLKSTNTATSPTAAIQSAFQLITAAKDAGFMGGEGGGAAEVAIEVARAATSAFEAWVATKTGSPPAGQQTVVVQPQQPQQPQQRPRITVMQRLDQLIKAHHNVNETASFFMEALVKDAEVKQRFASEGNDHEAFFKRYWAAWAMSNVAVHGPYVMELNKAVLAAAAARGWLPATAPAPQQAPQQPATAPQPAPVTPQAQPAPAAQQTVAAAVERIQQHDEELVDPGNGSSANGAEAAEEDEEPVDDEEIQQVVEQ